MILRGAEADDVAALMNVQYEGAVAGLGHIFPQDQCPFPREVLATRWRTEIASPDVQVYLYVDDDGAVCGLGAIRAGELLHFGTALQTWGSGAASRFLDALRDAMTGGSTGPTARLRVFEENRRARRFYEKNGWRTTGVRGRTAFLPQPWWLEYERRVH